MFGLKLSIRLCSLLFCTFIRDDAALYASETNENSTMVNIVKEDYVGEIKALPFVLNMPTVKDAGDETYFELLTSSTASNLNKFVDNATRWNDTTYRLANNWNNVDSVRPKDILPLDLYNIWKFKNIFGHNMGNHIETQSHCRGAVGLPVLVMLMLNLGVLSYILFGGLAFLNNLLSFAIPTTEGHDGYFQKY